MVVFLAARYPGIPLSLNQAMTFAFLVCGGPLWQKSHWWVTGWVMGWSKWTCGELCANLDTIGNSYWFNDDDDDDVIIEQGNPECHGISISVPLQINCSFWPCSSVLFIWGLYSAWVNPSWLGMTGAYPLTDRNQSKTMPNFTRLGFESKTECGDMRGWFPGLPQLEQNPSEQEYLRGYTA